MPKRRRMDDLQGSKEGPAGPSPFSLMSGSHSSGVHGGVFLSQLCPLSLGPDIHLHTSVISTYQIDLSYLHQHHCPSLFNANHVAVLHGGRNGGTDSERMRDECMLLGLDLNKMTIHAPPTQNYGTHHSKFVILFYANQEGPIGMRVIITSANFIRADLESKTQTIWWQDFPSLAQAAAGSVSAPLHEFAFDLSEYFSYTGINQVLNGTNQRLNISQMIQRHDCSAARVKLIASVPGWHSNDQWGHLKLRRHLQSLRPASGPPATKGRIILQYTSLGKVDEKWLFDEFGVSLAGPLSPTIRANPSSLFRIIWPTVCQVRDSSRGWASGSSIPGSSENVNRPFLLPLNSKWDGLHHGRSEIMPHMKSYASFAPDGRILWALTGSHNLSKVAWGLMSREGNLGIQSYELSVLSYPALEEQYLAHPGFGYQVVPLKGEALNEALALNEAKALNEANRSPAKVEFWPSSSRDCITDSDGSVIKYSPALPYDRNPKRYERDDKPWCRETLWDGWDSQGLAIQEALHL